jgi:Putative auto-transporter adhesin, head GIN domain
VKWVQQVILGKRLGMHLKLSVTVSLLILALVSCTFAQTRGSGKIISESRDVSGFTGIALESTGDITITQGESESLSIETDDNLLPLLTSKVENGVLVLSTQDNTYLEPSQGIRYTITVKSLENLEISGSGNIDANNLALDSLSVEISGSGNIRLSGKVNSQSVDISGSGDYNGCDLQSSGSSVSISGSGDIRVAATDTLSIDISGAGDVTYLGNPEVSQDISGVGDIQQSDSCE